MALLILFVFLTLATVECRVRNDTDGPCSMSPCLNGGICNESTSSSLGYVCLCPSWYRGSRCDVSSSCLSSPCQNGGTCKVSKFLSLGYWCYCPSGYSGNNCDIFSSCSSSPCQNGGTCEDLTFSNLGYRCVCPPGYSGSNCDIYDQCSSSPCQNGGVCDVTFSILGYTCTCPSGYSGINCNFINYHLNFLPNPAPSASSRMTVIYILVPLAALLKLVLFGSCIYFRWRRIRILRPVTPSAKRDISNRTIPPLHEAPSPYCPHADVEGAGGLGTMNPGYDVTSAAPQQSVSSGVEPGIVSVNERNCPPSFEETVKPRPWHNDRQPLI